jgi:cell division septum initiation protein DivIVA
MPDPKLSAKQALVEREMLNYVEQALRVALAWETTGPNCERKISTVRFTAQSFHRHLKRMRALAEEDGYLTLVIEAKPQFAAIIEDLRHRRDALEAELDAVMTRIDGVSPSNAAAVDAACADVEAFLDALKEHGAQETELIQEALNQEEGGSG